MDAGEDKKWRATNSVNHMLGPNRHDVFEPEDPFVSFRMLVSGAVFFSEAVAARLAAVVCCLERQARN